MIFRGDVSGHPFRHKMKATKYIFRWHHWSGLIVGVLLFMMSITGSILTFSEELEALEDRSYAKVQIGPGMPSFDASFHTIRHKYPDWEIRLHDLPGKGKTLVYDLRKQEQSKKVYADPVTGEIIGVNQNANNSFPRQLLLLHSTLLSGTTGTIIVFITGLLFLISLFTGLIVYRRALVKVFTFRTKFHRKTISSLYSSLHRIIGVWSVLFNLVIVVTGLWLSGQMALEAIKTPVTKVGAVRSISAIQSIDEAIRRIAGKYPDFEIHLLRIRPGSNMIQVLGRSTSDPVFYGNLYSGFTIDGAKLEILSSYFMKDMSAKKKLSNIAGPLHFGKYGGIPLKIIYCLLGFTPAILSISGFVLWRKRGNRI
jgi:uncharacterized iron-regulated membrane protein